MRLHRLAWSVLGINLFVILWGAFVRASGSGAGCGRHWPLCNGVIVPTAPATATLIELTHRVTSGLALLLVGWLFWRSRRLPAGHAARRWAAWSLLFIVTEALVGAGLVLLALVGADASPARAAYLAVHLLNTFLLLGALALTAYAADPATVAPPRLPRASGSLLGLALILLVAMTGAVTALGDTLFPSQSLSEGLRADTSATAHLLIRLRVAHPVLAVLTGSYLLIRLGRGEKHEAAGGWGRVVAGLVVFQLFLGLSNLLLLAPTALQLAHLLTADLLWVASVVHSAARGAGDPTRERVSLAGARRGAAAPVPE